MAFDPDHEGYLEEVRAMMRPGAKNYYLPSPDEIAERRAILAWLQTFAGNDYDFLTAVMVYDSPSLELVVSTVQRLGGEVAYDRLRRFVK